MWHAAPNRPMAPFGDTATSATSQLAYGRPPATSVVSAYLNNTSSKAVTRYAEGYMSYSIPPDVLEPPINNPLCSMIQRIDFPQGRSINLGGSAGVSSSNSVMTSPSPSSANMDRGQSSALSFVPSAQTVISISASSHPSRPSRRSVKPNRRPNRRAEAAVSSLANYCPEHIRRY